MDSNKPDQTDIGILNLLQKDGLMTNKELAHKLKKTITPIVERIKRLKQDGYIKNIVAIIDVQKIKTVFIAFPHIQLTNHSEKIIMQFQEEMRMYQEVLECYHITGQFDFIIKIVMPDMVTYNDFIRNKIGSLEYIGYIQSFLVISEIKRETAYQL